MSAGQNHNAMVALESVLDELALEKDGEFVVSRLENFYRSQLPENQLKLDGALRAWLTSGNLIRADYAIALSSRLQIRENLSALKAELRAIEENRSKLPDYFRQFLLPAIASLRS